MNFFFLIISFPRIRREVPSLRGERGKLAYTGQNIVEKTKAPLPSFLSGEQNRNDTKRKKIDCLRERRIRHRLWENAFNIHILCLNSYRSRWSGMAFHSLLQRRSAPRKVVHLPSLRSRMTGRYLLPFCKKLFYLSSPTCLFRQAGMAFLPESFSYFCFYSYLFLSFCT